MPPEPAAMENAIDVIRRLHGHRLWMRRRLLDATAELTSEQWLHAFDIGRGSLWSTVEHLYVAELVWITALEGTPDMPVQGNLPEADLTALHAAWQPVDQRWSTYLNALTTQRLADPIERYSALWQRHYTTHAGDILLHVATHAAYTTAQAMNMLRHLGVDELPGMDLILMSREEWDAPKQTPAPPS